MSEQPLYADDNLEITSTRLIIAGTTYHLRNLTSVRVTHTPAKKFKKAYYYLEFIFGVIVFPLLGIGWLIDGRFILGFIALAIGAFGGYSWFRKIKDHKNLYHIELTSASGVANVLTAEDPNYIQTLIGHINDALAKQN